MPDRIESYIARPTYLGRTVLRMNFAGYSYPVLTHEQISGQIENAMVHGKGLT